MEAAAAGLVAVPAEVADALLSAAQSLTACEMHVLGMMGESYGNEGTATRPGISSHRANSHVATVLSKLHAATRAEAVAVGARLGLVPV